MRGEARDDTDQYGGGVGFFLLLGLLALGYLAVKLGKMEVVGGSGYTVQATFSNVAGLRVGTSVEIAGVDIGWVERISLKNYQAVVAFRIQDGVQLLEDSIASIRTKGLIGEQLVRISPGGAEKESVTGGMRSKKRSRRWTLWN